MPQNDEKLKNDGYFEGFNDSGIEKSMLLIQKSDYYFMTFIKQHPHEPEKTMVMFQFPGKSNMNPERLKKAFEEVILKLTEFKDKIK